MKKIIYTLFAAVQIVALTTSCKEDKGNNYNVSGYVKSIDDMTFNYDSSGRVSNVEDEDCSIDYTYGDRSVKCVYRDKEDGSAETDIATLNEDGNLIEVLEEDNEGFSYTDEYFYKNNALYKINSRTYVEWEDGNMTELGDDKFSYSDNLNNYSVDINMFLTNTENMVIDLYSYSLGFENSIGGIHSRNLMSQCSEEGCTYDINYEFDNQGRVIRASWNKYGSGNGSWIDITYY